MKNYENLENVVPMVNEPSQPYSVMNGVSKPGKMTVNEYFDEVWKRVVEKQRSKTIKMIHLQARRMVSHNKKWDYIFHIEEGIVVVDRIMA
ncbi:MAG: hypothetical protein IJT45_07090 [Bacteroidales bacterium]|nr:hypothetical protein [Bacteroidales bacterium]